jgi:hypothetical protein
MRKCGDQRAFVERAGRQPRRVSSQARRRARARAAASRGAFELGETRGRRVGGFERLCAAPSAGRAAAQGLLAEPAGHEPVELIGPRRPGQRARQRDAHAVRVGAGLEAVGERHPLPRDVELTGIVAGRQRAGIAARNIGGRHRERARIRRLAAPGEQTVPVANLGRQPRLVERRDGALASEEIALAQPRLPSRAPRAARGYA